MGHKLGAQRRKCVKPCAQGLQLAGLHGGQLRVGRHRVQHGAPQADLIGVGRIQQQVGARLVGLDEPFLARADMAPQPQREGSPVPAEQVIPNDAPRQYW